ncbi:MAG: class I adenylate-forming enzyme family protein [Elusimicrobiota bacterium]
MNICSVLKDAALSCGDKTAVVEGEEQLTYSGLWDCVKNLGEGLRRIGIKENDRVALILPTSKDFLLSFFALMKINAVAIPFEPVFTTGEYKKMFRECKPKAVITSSYIILKILGFEEYLIKGRKIIISDSDPWIKKKYKGSCNFKELMSQKGSGDMDMEGENIASINYTYRGFGYPVGAMLSHSNYYYGARALDNVAIDAKSFLSVLPMAHIFCLIAGAVAPVFRKAMIVILKSHSAREIYKKISHYKIDLMIGVPTLYIYLMKVFRKDRHDVSSLKYPISGGNFMNEETQREIKNTMGLRILQGYGLTEALIVSANSESANKPPSVGLAGKGVEVKIYDNENKKECETKAGGEIIIKGPTVMKSFYKKEKESRQVLRDGWLHTGDYGHIDGEGYLYFDGLKKNIAKVGGESIDLREIEEVLHSHPCIRDVNLRAGDDELWGQKIIANVDLGKDMTKDEIETYCRGRLASFKVPKVINIS